MTHPAPRLTLDEWLRAAYDDPAAGCPPPESWLEEELATRSAEERRRLEAHAAHCPACAAERDLAQSFDAGPEAAGVRPEDVAFVVSRLEAASPVSNVRDIRARETAKVVPFPTRRRIESSPVWRLAAAAVLVIAAGLAFQLSRPGAPPLPAPQVGGVVRGGEVEAVSPLGEVAGIPAELRWLPHPGARSYRVRLSTVDDTVLWETTVPATSAPLARLPAEVIQKLHRAVAYLWTVEALGPAGERMGASEPVRFRARPAPEGAEQ
ncbi:MAG TPA: hypothetical protein VGS07_17540 [Thermoanaerobaculia bacterium]|jgi:hypothetical protein|nr:hypothetical protein [Thermoanaerobaculia bacterium]